MRRRTYFPLTPEERELMKVLVALIADPVFSLPYEFYETFIKYMNSKSVELNEVLEEMKIIECEMWKSISEENIS